MEGISEDRIILEYKTSDPIDLELLSSSFAGLANQYRRAMDRLDMESEKTNVRLLITRIEEGSIEVEIGVAAVAFLHAFQFMDYSIIFSDFTIRIKSILDYFAKGAERPTNLDRSDCRDIKSFIGAVEGSKDGSLAYRHAKFHRKTKERETLIEFSFDTLSLRRAAANIEKEVEDIDTKERPSFKTVPNVLFRWYQTNKDDAKTSGARSSDKGIIEDISPDPVYVFFPPAAEILKRKMTLIDENPFRKCFVVDVHVKFSGDIPKIYTILEVNDIVDDVD